MSKKPPTWDQLPLRARLAVSVLVACLLYILVWAGFMVCRWYIGSFPASVNVVAFFGLGAFVGGALISFFRRGPK